MKKFIMIISLITAIISTSSVFATQHETTEEIKPDAVEECHVHPADGIVSCKD